ncbi:MAG: LVIVD repeat-containing protein [Actinomycetota bacterium]
MRVPKVAAAVSIVLVLGIATPVVAHPGNEWSTGPIPHDRVPHVHDDAPRGSGPATPASTDNFQILSHLVLPGRASDADIALYDHGRKGLFAYVGSWRDRCRNDGVKVIDVTKPRHPKVAAVAKAPGDNYSSEDMDIVAIGDRAIMGVGLQACGRRGRNAFAFFDVTKPGHPLLLSTLRTPTGVHELDLVVRPDGVALALGSTPFSDFGWLYFGEPSSGEVQIVDISDPADPRRLSRWSLIDDSDIVSLGGDPFESSFQGMGSFATAYAHSVRAADDGDTVYVSYWDAGVVKLDISDPSTPSVVGRTQYAVGDDGDAHSMFPLDVGGTRYLLQNDEDYDPDSPVQVRSSVTGSEWFTGIDMGWMPQDLQATGQIAGDVVDAGDGCQGADYAGAAGNIAVVDTIDFFYSDLIDGWPEVPCRLIKQTRLASRAGAAALVSNFISPDDAWEWPFGRPDGIANDEDTVVIQVNDTDGLVQAIRDDGGPATITMKPTEPAVGYLRIFDESMATDGDGDGVPEFEQVGTFTGLDHVVGDPSPPRRGVWSVHNTEVLGDRAYASWYSHGIVALDVTDPTAPQLVGQFVPAGQPFPDVWGVAVDPETGLVYASDIGSGLWIVRPMGDAVPGG